MPFTFAHPAIVLPLKKLGSHRVSTTALVIGSMIPDFEGFIKLGGKKFYSHTLPGMFWFDLPLGMAILFMFHLLVRNQLIEALPRSLRARFVNYKSLDWLGYFRKHPFVVTISMLAGIFSHLLWDSLTHTFGYLLVGPLGLDLSVPQLVTLQDFLQWGSSLVGIVVILYALARMPLQPAEPQSSPLRFWLIVLVVTTIVCLLTLRRDLHLFTIANNTTSGFLLGIVIASAARKYFWRDTAQVKS
jgi:hypothetical protein